MTANSQDGTPPYAAPAGDARPASSSASAVTVVIATRNRAAELDRTLGFLTSLPERPPVIVVDNASGDGTPAMMRRCYPQVEIVALPQNRGACARNVGAVRAATPYVAFSDDDSWWEPGALRAASALLDAYPGLGLIAARIQVGPAGDADPVNAVMAASPLDSAGLPGPRVLGFLGCAAVVRRSAFLAVGGFSELLFIGGEEQLVALDLAALGVAAVYVSDVTAQHWPSGARDSAQRRYLLARNDVLVAWLRRPAGTAAAATARLALRAGRDRTAARALGGVLLAMPKVLPLRRVLPAAVEGQVRLLARAAPGPVSAAQGSQQAGDQ